MKRTKRVISVLLAVLAGAALLCAGSVVSYADTFFDEGDFCFAVANGNRVLLAGYKGEDTELVLPASVGERAVTGVRANCFENTSLKSVVIPEGYTTIGAFAFSGCQNLTAVSLPASLETIGIMAFNNCGLLSQIDFSAATELTDIAFAAFSGCRSLEAVVMSDAVSSIGENVFSGCETLSTLHLSNSLTELPEYAFYGCAALTAVDFPPAVATIGGSCFENTSLSDQYLPESITEIGGNAFAPANAVVCFENTAAAAYCQNSGAEQARILQKIMGDVNFDTVVNINDVTAVQRHLCEAERFAPYQMITADVNGDGRVSVDDATLIQMVLAEFDVQL